MAAVASAPAFVPTATAPAPIVKGKATMIRAASGAAAATGEVVVLSPIDGVMPRYPSTTTWLYRNDSGSANFLPAVALKRSLAQVLSQYPILAGTLRDRADGNFEVVLSNQGVAWIDAVCDAPYPTADAFGPETVPLPAGRELLAMECIRLELPCAFQLTRYACGSAVLAFSVWHSLLDGHAQFHFANHWAALTRAAANANGDFAAAVRATAAQYPPPLHDRWGLLGPAVEPSDLAFHYDHNEYDVAEPPKPAAPAAAAAADAKGDGKAEPKAAAPAFVMPKCTTKLFHFSAAELDAMKAAAQRAAPAGEFVSTNDALCAHIWRCTARARTAGLSDADAANRHSAFGMACNGRARLVPPLPDHYCGNVNFYIAARRSVADLRAVDAPAAAADAAADGKSAGGCVGLSTTALQLRRGVERMTNDRLRAAVRWLADQPDLKLVKASFQSFFTLDSAFTQWSKMGMYDADFGSGKPLYVGVPNVDLDGLALLYAVPPAWAHAKGTGQAVHFGLVDAHMQRLLADPEWRRFRPATETPAPAITAVPTPKRVPFADTHVPADTAADAAAAATAAAPVTATDSKHSAATAHATDAAAGADTERARGLRTAMYVVSAAAFVAGALLAYRFFSAPAAAPPKAQPK